MGKGNRTKREKATNVLAASKSKKSSARKREMPTWAGTLILVLVLAMILGVAAFSILSNRGVFMRGVVVMSSENYEITLPMMSYLIYTERDSFVSQYQNSGYMQYIRGSGGDGLNTALPLSEQAYSRVTDEATGVVTVTTWLDYFRTSAQVRARQLLVLCEQAKAHGVVLDAEDYAEIDTALENIDLYASYYGQSSADYISTQYGKGVIKKDLRNVMELSVLASKFSEIREAEIEEGLTDWRVESYYEANRKDFDVYIDYIGYTFKTSFTPVKDTEEDAATKNAEAYQKYQDEKTLYEGYVNALKDVADDRAAFDALLLSYFQEIAKKDDPETADSVAIAMLQDALHKDHKKGESSELDSWLFPTEEGALREVGDVKTDIDKGTDGYNATTEKYTAVKAEFGIFVVLSKAHRDEAHYQNVGHILLMTDTYKDLKSADSLKGEIKALAESVLAAGNEKLSAELMANALLSKMKADGVITESEKDGKKYWAVDKAKFEEFAKIYNEDSNIFYDDVARGDMVEPFDAWLYNENRIEGEISYPKAISTQYGYHIMYYVGEGEEINWEVSVRDKMASAEYEKWYEEIDAATEIFVSEKDSHWQKLK